MTDARLHSLLARYPSAHHLQEKARGRVPRFAWEYLEGGCNDELNLSLNRSDLDKVLLKPHYLGPMAEAPGLHTTLFGTLYHAPFGVAPIGLQGLIWPGSCEMLARAAHEAMLPFVLSTVSTANIEHIAEITEGKAWFQLYHPRDAHIRNDLLDRAKQAGIKVLVALADVPVFGYRHRDMANGLAMPPHFNWRNVWQAAQRPAWVAATLRNGLPEFKNLAPYLQSPRSIGALGKFMNSTFSGRLTADALKGLRDAWPHTLVVKGIASEEDAQRCADLGVDGVVVSNHGGRQLDCGESSIASLRRLAPFANRLTLLMDGGIRSGVDVARALATGAEATFAGRTFMYGAAALGLQGASLAAYMLRVQLTQVMAQLGCQDIYELKNRAMT